MYDLYLHFKGNPYLKLFEAKDSEQLQTQVVYRCLYDNSSGLMWTRPKDMFEGVHDSGVQRFKKTGLLRKVTKTEMPQVLKMGYDAWGEGKSLEDFFSGYEASEFHKMGTRYLIEDLEGTICAALNTIPFSHETLGIASVVTAPERRNQGHASLLLKAILALFQDVFAYQKFILFSEIDPGFYQKFGFVSFAELHQKFLPAVAMGKCVGSAQWNEADFDLLKRYF